MVTQNRLRTNCRVLVSCCFISVTSAAQKKSPENKNTEPTAQVDSQDRDPGDLRE